MRRRQNAHVDRDAPSSSQLLDFALLQHAQQLRLQRQRNVADFVEKDRPAFRHLEFSRTRFDPGGDAALDAEEFRLQQRLRQRGAIDRDERSVFARRVAVNETRHHLFASSRLAANQHAGLRIGDARDEIDDALHLRRVADHQSIGVLPQHSLLQRAVLVFEGFAHQIEPVKASSVVDRCSPDCCKRRQESQIVIDEAAALRATLFFSADADDADDHVARHHRREQQIASTHRHRFPRRDHLPHRRLGEKLIAARVDVEGVETLHVQFFVERKGEAERRVEDADGAMHQFFEQLRFGAQRIQRASDIVERFELKQLPFQFEVGLGHDSYE